MSTANNHKKQIKVCFYIAWHPPPGRHVHSDTNLTSLGSIQPHSNYCAETIHSQTIQLSELGPWCRERKCPIFKTAEKVIQTQDLSIESPAFYR